MANEKRLIDANALIARFREIADIEWNHRVSPVCWSDAYEKICDDVERATTVDAVEVVHGWWIDKTEWIGSFGQVRTECSICGTIYPHKPGSRGDGKGGKFCEECGARMDGDGNG